MGLAISKGNVVKSKMKHPLDMAMPMSICDNQTTIVFGHNLLTNRLADVQLRRLRFWSYTRTFTDLASPILCFHCQQTQSGTLSAELSSPPEGPKKTKI